MPPEAAISSGETGLVTSVQRANIVSREVEVIVPARNTSDTATALIVLTLREGRSADARNTPDTTGSDIETLGPLVHVPGVVVASRSGLATSSPPQEATLRFLIRV